MRQIDSEARAVYARDSLALALLFYGGTGQLSMQRYQYWLGWTYQYLFWCALIVLGWYFLGKSWGPTAPFWEREDSRLVEKKAFSSLVK